MKREKLYAKDRLLRMYEPSTTDFTAVVTAAHLVAAVTRTWRVNRGRALAP
jgi:hypothetical protein